jgi:WD40 repeat protein
LVTLLVPALATASIGTWLKGALHLGLYRERVATLQATLPEDHGTWGLAFSPHGRYLAASSPQTAFVQLWDWRKGRVVRRFRKIGSDISSTTALAYSPDGRYLASCHDGAPHGAVQVWNVQAGAEVARLFGPHGSWDCSAITFSPHGRSLYRVTDDDGPKSTGFVAYSTRTWTQRWALATRPFIPNALAVSAQGHWAALGGGTYTHKNEYFVQQIALVDLTHHTLVRLLKTFPAPPPRLIYGRLVPVANEPARALAWNPRAFEVVTGQYGVDPGGSDVIRVYDLKTGAIVAHEPGPLGTGVTALRYTPQGRYLIEAGIHHEVEIWDGSHQHLLQKIPHQAWSLAVSSHGHYLALGEGREIQVWRFR